MNNNKDDNDAGLADFTAGWDKRLGENVQLPVGFALIALTNSGEKRVSSACLSEVTGRPVSDVETLAQAPCGSNSMCATPVPVHDGFCPR